MENQNTVLSHESFRDFQATQKQRDYFKESIYDIVTPEGHNYHRNLELISFNALTGNILVRERISYEGTKYEKVYILSREGKAEKYRTV